MVDVVKVKLAIDILRIHIESKRNYIHIAGSLTVAEKSSLYTLGTCKKTELGSCDRSTAVIVRMKADYGAVTVFKVTLSMTLFSGVAPSSSKTLWHISTALSISVPVKLSGEYS